LLLLQFSISCFSGHEFGTLREHGIKRNLKEETKMVAILMAITVAAALVARSRAE
jgi:hypothetical protein